MNFHELDNFNLSDTVKYHNRLNPRLWGRDEHLLPDVRDKLLAIAEDFREFLGVDDLKIQDITLSGSNAAYNYTNRSDIDLHLVVDMPDDPVYQELFNAKKYQYNNEHNLTIGGADVELYVQPADQPHVSQGIYSVRDGKWIQVPRRKRAQIDDSCVRDKAADLDARIHAAVGSNDAAAIDALWNKIKTMRQTGLEQHGEFGCENIVFKVLRDQGCIKLLKDAKLAARDHELSLAEQRKVKSRVTYGFGDQVTEDVTITPDGVSASTRMFLSEKGDEDNQAVNDFIQHVVKELGIDPAPEIVIHTDPEWSEGNHSFGRYEPESNTLNVSMPNRHILDVFRTIAHELVHCDQHQKQGGLPPDAGETGSEYENDANARAGIIMRDFAAAHPEYFGQEPLGEGAHAHLSVPPVLYHATYRPLLRSIKRGGLGGPGSEKKKWEDSIHGAVYLALDPHVAESYAETSDSVPDDWLDEIVILQISTAGLNPSKFMLDRNVRDNAGDTVEYHGIIPLSNISVLKKNMSEASGYIPTKKQARDPRFVMALTRDVRPGAVGKEANKLGLQTDSQGHPALLTAGLQKMLREFKEQDLFEIRMSPTNLKQLAAKTGALAGMEFEMIVPNTQGGDDYDQEPDYDMDERASSPQDIRDFFHDGDYNGRRDVDRLIDSMIEDFSDWQSEAFDNRWESDSEQFIYDYIRENMDDDDVRGLLSLEPDDDITKKEYQLAADKIVADQLEPWYEDAQESAREEFYDDDDLFEEWLADSGLTHMSDIESRYNITWPYYRSVSSGEGASVQETAESFSQAVGRPARASDSYHEYGQERPAPGKNFYVVEPDGSLEPDDPDDAGLEFVSPPLPIDEIMSDLNKVKKWADLNGCYTNKSTGLHINISVPNYDLDRLDFVKLALLMGDEYVLNQFGRASNTYARSAMGKVRDHVQKRPYEAKYLLDKMKGHMGELASKAIHSGSTEKYTSINTKNGHVEFRSPGGDWLGDNFDKIENTLLRFTVALSAAMDPAAYREEYLKKLYKILAPKDEKDPLAVFAKYAAGELPKQALKSFVRQAQTERQVKKSGEAIVNGHRWSVRLKPELGGGEVEVIAADPIDAKKEAIKQQPNWRFVDDSALTITRLDEPTASTTTSPSQSRGRPNDPNGRYAIVRRDDQRNYGNHVGSEAPYYIFRFTLPDGYTSAQMNAVLQAWAARHSVNPDDYIIVDTTHFAAPAPAASEPSNMRWNIINSRNEIVHSFWNRNVQADANAVAREWFYNNNMANSPDGPFEVVPATAPTSQSPSNQSVGDTLLSQTDVENRLGWGSQAADANYEVVDRQTMTPVFKFIANTPGEAATKYRQWLGAQGLLGVTARYRYGRRSIGTAIPGSTLDLQRQRQAAPLAYGQPPRPIPGLEDIELDIEQNFGPPAQPAQTQWEVYDRSTGNPVFRMYAANQQEAWRKGQEWVANYARMTPDQAIDPANYSVRQSTAPVTESISVLEQRLRRELDALGNQPPTGPETPPKMPDGTIKVDVSDMYDWYKLGQHISDLSSIDKSTLGKGPPSTVFAFGSEDLENKYSHELTNLGLKTHDLDEPGEEDVDEAFDRPYKTKTEKSESGSYDMLARLPDGTYLSIMFNNQGNDEWQVEFYRNNSQEVTGEGDAQRIFATVLNAIQKFVKKHKPLQITFSASKEVEAGQNSESRAKLYNRLVDRYAAALGYHARTIEHTNAVSYELTRYSDQSPFEENFVKPGVDVSLYRMPELLIPRSDVAEGLEQISIKVRKGRNKFATELSVDGKPAGVYQYDADSGRSIAEVDPEYRGKGLGKIMVLHAIYTAAKLGMDFVEDESRTAEYDNVLDSLEGNGLAVNDDGYWYVTGQGEQYLKQRLKQGVAESEEVSDDSPG